MIGIVVFFSIVIIFELINVLNADTEDSDGNDDDSSTNSDPGDDTDGGG